MSLGLTQSQAQGKIKETLTEYLLNGRKVVMLSFNGQVSSSYVLEKINNLNLKPANVQELQLFLKKNESEELKDAIIVPMGTKWKTINGKNTVPYKIKEGLFGRHSFNDEWDKGCLFMALK